MFNLWWTIVGIVILAALSIYDIRTRKIPVFGLAVVFIFSIVSLICFADGPVMWLDIFLSLIPGLMLIGFGIITEGKVGIADGIIIAELGLAMGFERCVYVLTGALLLNCIFAGIVLVLHKVRPQSRIPFVPFITVSMGVISFVFR